LKSKVTHESKSKVKHTSRYKSLDDFTKLHGCSTECAKDLYRIGMRNYKDIKNSDPDKMCNKLIKLEGKHD
jgi:hypothetical protein